MVVEAADSGDVDHMRDGFITLKTSCIACHKRYSPAY